ncbi:MAG: leukotoxin LktA family filamentous adhesin, partial [Cyanobacteriota bacterium]
MIRSIKRKMLKRRSGSGSVDFMKMFASLAIATTVYLTPAYAQQMVIDGKTATNLDVNSNVTTVTTTTFKGPNAFNSFYKFNVTQGNIVNLVVPDNSSNLINLIHNEATSIDGVLNSIKNGHVGGNIFLVNPHGITIGSQGVVNVGSLTAITPTKDYMNNFFLSPGNPDDTSVINLLNGNVPINTNATIKNNGVINAIETVKLDTGNFTNTGDINTGAVFEENDIELGDVVNLNTLESGAEMAVESGSVVIKATGDITNQGKIVADGGNNVDAGSISLKAGNDVVLETGSLISTKGKGENSAGGDVYVWGDNDAYFHHDAVLDARGGDVSGDAGVVELSSKDTVYVGGEFKATATEGETGTIIIDPLYIDSVKYIGAGYINDGLIYTDGANLIIGATDDITANNVLISTRNIAAGSGGDQFNDASVGNSGNLTFTAQEITISDVDLLTFATNGYSSGDVELHAAAYGYTNSLLEVNNSSFINAGDGTVSLLADNSNTSNTGASVSITDSTVLADNIEIKSHGGIDIANKTSYAHSYIVNSTIKANTIDIRAEGDNTSLSDPFANSEGKIIATNSIIEGYEDLIIYAKGANGFNSDARAQFFNVDMKSANANIDVITGSSIGSMGSLIASDLDFVGGTFDAFVDSANGTALINMDAATSISSGSFAKELNVNADGTVNRTSSNIGASSNINIDVDDISTQYITLNADSVSGSATLDYYTGQAQIEITNNSTKPLVMNFVDTDQYGYVQINGSTYENYGSFIINKHEDLAPKPVIITDNASTGIYLNDTINNISNTVTITSAAGDIVDNTVSENYIITAENINLYAPSGDIGSVADDDIDIDLFGTTGSLTANAYGLVNISETDGDLRVDHAESTNNDIILTSETGSILETSPSTVIGQSISLYAYGYLGTIGTSEDALNIDLDGGELTAYAEGIINLYENDGNLLINYAHSNNDDVYLETANGSIYETSSTPIHGYNINLVANGYLSEIGSDVEDLNVELTGGQLNASTDGLINIMSDGNDIHLSLVQSYFDDVTISTGDGASILNGEPGTNVRGVNITFNSDGSIGTIDEDVDIDLIGGDLTAYAYDLINIQENNGELLVNHVESYDNDVYLSTENGSINESSETTIIGENIFLYAGGYYSSIGEIGDEVTIDLLGGSLTATAEGIINIEENEGDLIVDHVESYYDDVYLESYDGSILQGSPSTVVGNNIYLNSPLGSIGSGYDALTIDTLGGKIFANANNDIYLNEISGDLIFDQIIANNGVVSLSTDNGSILQGSGYTIEAASDITFNAGYGSIGTIETSVDVELNGNLTAYAYGLINLYSENSDLNINHVESYSDDVYLTAYYGSILEASGSTVVGYNINLESYYGSIGEVAAPLHIDLQGGELDAFAYTGINITEDNGNLFADNIYTYYGDVKLTVANGDIVLDHIESYDGDVALYANGSISDVSEVTVKGYNVYLEAYYGEIGNGYDPLNIDLQGGYLTAYADGDINIFENDGDLVADKVRSYYGDVSLKTNDGSILRANTNKIIGADVNLTALGYNNTIGTLIDPLYIELTGGVLNASSSGLINITTEFSNLYFGLVESYDDNVILNTVFGSIYDFGITEDAKIIGYDITLNALNGLIGADAEPLHIDLQGGMLSAQAFNEINIIENTGDLVVNHIESFDSDVYLAANGSILEGSGSTVAGYNIELNAYYGIGTDLDALNIDLYGGRLDAYSNMGDIFINEINGDMELGVVEAYNGDVTLTTDDGSILNTEISTNIEAINITLDANNGTIGSYGDAVDIILDGGVLNATAYGVINLEADSGDLVVEHIESTSGEDDVILATINGNIIDASSETIIGYNISLNAGYGAIGLSSDSLNIDLQGGELTAYAGDSIYINENNNDLEIYHVESSYGDVTLTTTDGSIFTSPTTVVGNNITLKAYGYSSSIGAESDPLYIDLNGGTLYAYADGLINIESQGDMTVDHVESISDDVYLRAYYGSIYESSPETIIGNNINLEAYYGSLGTYYTPLNIDLQGGELTAYADGLINIVEIDSDLTINHVESYSGSTALQTINGSILQGSSGDAVIGYDVYLNAGYGTIGTGYDQVNINLQGGYLLAYADGLININEDDGDLNAFHVESYTDDVYLSTSDGGIFEYNPFTIIGEDIKLMAYGYGSSIGNAYSTVNIDLKGGMLTASAYGTINITEVNGDLLIDQVESTSGYDEVLLTAEDGSILENDAYSVIGYDIFLNAINGSIGTIEDGLNIDLEGGELTAYADGLINIYEYNGDLLVNHVESFMDDVILTTYYGSILENSRTTVVGGNITLEANGSGSTIGDDIDTVHIDLQGGVLNALAYGTINLTEIDGDMVVDHVESTSGYGDIYLSTDNGSILEISEETIIGQDIYLNAGYGSIGSVLEDLNIDLLGGRLTAYADGIINITELDGDLDINYLESYNNDVILSTVDGSILGGSGYTTVGTNIQLNALGYGSTIGTGYSALEIELNGGMLNAYAYGLVNVKSTDGDMGLGIVESETGEVILAANNGSILDETIDENPNVIGTNITFNAGYGTIGTIDTDGDIDIDLVASELNATAYGVVNISELDSEIELGLIDTDGDVYLTTPGNIKDINGAGYNVIANNAIINASSVYTVGEYFDVDLSGGLTVNALGVVQIQGDIANDINITGTDIDLTLTSDMYIGVIDGTNIDINTPGDIYDVNAELDNIFANTLVINSSNIYNLDLQVDTTTYIEALDTNITGLVGNLTADVNSLNFDDALAIKIDVDSINDVNIYNANVFTTLNVDSTLGNVYIEGSVFGKINITGYDITMDATSNLQIETIISNSNVDIASIMNILDAKTTEDVNISAYNIDLESINGSIGTLTSDLNIELYSSTLNASAFGIINITANTGNMELGLVESATNNVRLKTLNGSILDATGSGDRNVIANQVFFNVTNGSLGSLGSGYDVVVDVVTPNFNYVIDGDINLTLWNGDIALTQIKSNTGSIELTANNGRILDVSVSEDPNVIANNITLNAGYGSVGLLSEDLDIDLQGGYLNSYASDVINIYETSGDLNIDHVESYNDDVYLTTYYGSILEDSKKTVIGEDITLVANGPGSSIGNSLYIELQGGQLIAYADGAISITSENNDIIVNHVESYSDDVYLSANDGSILEGSGSTIKANNIELNSYNNIGEYDDYLQVDLQGGLLSAYSYNGDIYINEADGDMDLGSIYAYWGSASLSASNGSILSGQPTNNVTGYNITLDAVNGSIGTNINPLIIESWSGGELNASASNDIFILQSNGDLNLGTVQSYSGDVSLVTNDGNIYNNSSYTNIYGYNISLDSNNGGIGDSENTFGIDLQGGALNATADNNIYITENNGDLVVEHVESYYGDTSLSTINGSIIDEFNVTVIGNNITLEANGGGIGLVTDFLNIDLNGGMLNAYAYGDIFIYENNGDIGLGLVESGEGGVYLETDDGSILNDAPETNIIGTMITLVANGFESTIGTDLDAIDIILNDGVLNANAEGVINIEADYGDIVVQHIESTSDDVYLATVSGSIIDNSSTTVIGYDISLNANNGSIGTGYDALNIDLQGGTLTAYAYNNINIIENDGDLVVNHVESYYGDVSLSTEDGSILEGSGSTVVGYNVNLDAYYGSIGDNINDLIIDLKGGYLTAYADGDIYITEDDGDMAIGIIQSLYGDATLTTNNGGITESGLVSANDINFNVSFGNIDVLTDLQFGDLYAYANGTIQIVEVDGDMVVDHVESTDNDVYLAAINGSIVESEDLTIIGYNINLNAGYGTIGTIDEDLNIDLQGGVLTAYADGIINIYENNNDLLINHVESYNDDVYLTTNDGSILETSPDTIIGNDITLTAYGYGNTIGTYSDTISINLNGGYLTAAAYGVVNITEVDGDLLSYHVESTSGSDDVILTTLNGSIIEANPGTVIGYNIILDANNGSIGDLFEDLNIDTLGGNLTATADGIINVIEEDGDLIIDLVESFNDDVYLTAENGDILEGAGYGISGANIYLQADNGSVGLDGDNLTINLQGGGLDVYGYEGVYITETDGDLIASNVYAYYGDVELNANTGSIISDHIEAKDGDVSLIAQNNITEESSNTIIGYNINLNAGYGTIGTIDEDLNIDLQGGVLTAYADGIINITENDGNLNVSHVESYNDNVILTTQNGSILSPPPTIIGEDITLTAYGYGSTIGTGYDALTIDLQGGKLNAYADSDIYITENNGDMLVGVVESEVGDVSLTTNNGSILDGDESEDANIIANQLYFDITNGSLGSVDDDLIVDLATPNFNFGLAGDINLTLVDGDIELEQIESTSGSVLLTSLNGSIVDVSVSEDPNVIGENITLNAPNGSVGGLGDDDIDINLTASELNSFAYGLINIEELDSNIELGLLETSSDLYLLTPGNIIDNNGWDLNIIATNANISANNIAGVLGYLGFDVTNSTVINADNDAYLSGNFGDLDVNASHLDVYYGFMNDITVNVDSFDFIYGSADNVTVNGTGGAVNIFFAEIYGDLNVTTSDGNFQTISTIDGIATVNAGIGNVTMDIESDLNLDLIQGTNVDIEAYDVYDVNDVSDNIVSNTLVLNADNIYGDLDLNVSTTTNVTSGTTEISGLVGTFTANVDNLTYNNASAVGINVTGTDFVDINDALVFTNVIVNTAGNVDVDGAVFQKYDLTGNNVTITSNNNVNIEKIVATSNASVTTNLNILDGSVAETANITAQNINLTSNFGTIGTVANDLDIDMTTSTLNANASGVINITEINGNMGLGQVQSSTNDVYLTTLNGSILDVLVGEEANIKAANIQIVSTNGSVGSVSDDVDIDLTTGELKVNSTEVVNVEEINGNLLLEEILTSSDVYVKAYGSILDNKADETANIFGRSINITSAGIGTSSDDIDIYLNYSSSDGKLNAVSYYNNIYLSQYTGNMPIDYIVSYRDIVLTSPGSIIDLRSGESPNIYGRSINITSAGIGTSSDDVDIYLNYSSTGGKLNAVSYYNNIYLSQYTGNMPIDYIVSYRDIVLTSPGSIIDLRSGESPNIYGRSINITSAGIGTSSDDVDIYLNYSSSGGKLNAVSYYNNIYLSQYTGNMPIDYIVSYR